MNGVKMKGTIIKKMAVLPVFLMLLSFNTGPAGDNIPEINREIIKYVSTVIGKQVDRGECWDLAYQALTRVDAEWNMEYEYGQRIKPGKDKIYPGDLIQFKGVKLRYQKGNAIYTELYDHHTAIIYRLIDDGIFELAHQNTGFSGRNVGLSEFNLDHVTSGKMYFYRPVAKSQ